MWPRVLGGQVEGGIIPAWGWERVSGGDSPEHLACPSWVNAVDILSRKRIPQVGMDVLSQ